MTGNYWNTAQGRYLIIKSLPSNTLGGRCRQEAIINARDDLEFAQADIEKLNSDAPEGVYFYVKEMQS